MARRRRARLRARGRGRLLPAGRKPARVSQPGRRDGCGDLRDRPELPAVTVTVGIDVGATKIAAALVDVDTGSVVRSARQPTDASRAGTAVLDDCRSLASALAAGVEP